VRQQVVGDRQPFGLASRPSGFDVPAAFTGPKYAAFAVFDAREVRLQLFVVAHRHACFEFSAGHFGRDTQIPTIGGQRDVFEQVLERLLLSLDRGVLAVQLARHSRSIPARTKDKEWFGQDRH
jgi:hypothetical protein